MHFADVVIAIALRLSGHRDRDSFVRASGAEGLQHMRDHIRTTLRVLDALPIIATEELKQSKQNTFPGVVQLKVSGTRPKKATKTKSNATTVNAFPSSYLKAAGLRAATLLGGSSFFGVVRGSVRPVPSEPSSAP